MSELKATTVYDAYWKANSVGEGTGTHVYLKREADKVIAEKAEEIRRQKYKRCLAMARWCAKNVDHLNSEGYIYEKQGCTDELDDCIKGTEFYHKWYNYWSKLAEKLKEAK